MLTAGTRLGPYEITARLGEGGMGIVYRAKDSQLGRDVALKVLPESFATDPERLARFEREAKLLAALNHPNIAQIHGLETTGTTRALVIELVDGPTLAERLAAGPLPLDEALSYARQIAEALEEAHEKGIVHRDLKPQNIKVSTAGKVKVLDFGLAKALAPAGDSAAPNALALSPTLMNSPTLTAANATQRGVILGTAAYMSPEQARGKPADKRADIWAFGVVLWEMLTGRRLFGGETVSDTVAAVLRQEIDWGLLPGGTPPGLRRLLARCLERDPQLRLRDIGDARLELAPGAVAEAPANGPPPMIRERRDLTWWLGWGLAAGAALALVGLLFSRLGEGRSAAAATAPPLHLAFLPPKGERLFFDVNVATFAISPDGTEIAYAAEEAAGTRLHLRRLGAEGSTVVPGTEGAVEPFFSPDGKWIAFAAGGKLKKVAVGGGEPVSLADVGYIRGATWGEDGSIYFVPNIYAPITRVSSGGGRPVAVSKIRTREGEQQHRWPALLPGSRVLLYAIGYGASFDEATIVAERLDNGERTVLVRGGTNPRYLPTGHLLYARAGSLYAVPFDAAALKVTGPPVEVARGVPVLGTGRAVADVSRSGTLVAAAPDAARSATAISWVDRQGRGETIRVLDTPVYYKLALSSDGIRAAFDTGDRIAVLDIARRTVTALSLPARAETPTWSRDGRRVFFGLEKDKFYQIFSKAADDSGEPRHELASDAYQEVVGFTADGSRALAFRVPRDRPGELVLLQVDASSRLAESKVLLRAPLSGDGAFSPDARWVAYTSSESGQAEIYVRPASGEERQWQVSTEGGWYPIWSADGSEIFYLSLFRLVAAPVSVKADELVVGTPKVLFDHHRILAFDVSADGKRFLVAEDPNPGAPPKLDVVVNWFGELLRKMEGEPTP